MEQKENMETKTLSNSDDNQDQITILDWLAPLVIVLLLIIFGAWFCGGK
ncbi:MAG: hypothetical protein KatS3mg006_0104 [Pyrinomonadaceae bacterium]|jgi:flagellar biogenesis protein FliO|nr:MAG: hypothetical protein KatS3mg006_0104 [Pyrinomonadaceae bacterium]